jgi:ABC-type glycerol-3-phosphate transport system permease component
MVSTIKLTRADRAFNIANTLFLFLWFIAVAYPLYYIIIASFSDPLMVKTGKVGLWPVRPTFVAYEAVFTYPDIPLGFLNSMIYTVLGTFINVTMTVLAGYPLSRKELYGRNLIMGIFTFTMLFSGGLIPLFLVVRKLGLFNTRWAMVIPNAMAVWFVIIARTFFRSNIPDELYEASSMDGCSDIRFIRSVVLPLSGPILAVLALFYAVGHWNSYFDALIYLRKKNLFPLQIFLRNILLLNQVDLESLEDIEEMIQKQDLVDLLKYALIVVASIPVLIIYPVAQRHFVRGVMIGAIKG